MAEQYRNNVVTTLNGAIDDNDTSLVVTSATGFPTAGTFRILIKAEGANADEICTVTAVSGTTFTIIRASESTGGVQTASAHGNGATIALVLTAESLRNASNLNVGSGPHHKQIVVSGQGNYTTSSTTKTPIDATNLSYLTLDLVAGQVVRCMLTGQAYATGAVGGIDFEVDQPTSGNVYIGNANDRGVVSFAGNGTRLPLNAVGLFVVTETGVHGFRPVWVMESGGTSLTLVNGTSGNDDSPVQFSVEKLGVTNTASFSTAYLGKNAIGDTVTAATTRRVLMKRIIVPSDGILANVEVYGKNNSNGATPSLQFGVWEDTSGSPSRLIRVVQSQQVYLEQAGNLKEPRWIGGGTNVQVTGGTAYWIGAVSEGATFDFYRDASVGADRYYVMGFAAPGLADAGVYTVTTTTDDYSIRALFVGAKEISEFADATTFELPNDVSLTADAAWHDVTGMTGMTLQPGKYVALFDMRVAPPAADTAITFRLTNASTQLSLSTFLYINVSSIAYTYSFHSKAFTLDVATGLDLEYFTGGGGTLKKEDSQGNDANQPETKVTFLKLVPPVGTIKDFAMAKRTSGNITANSTSWANLDTGLDLALIASVGDVIEVGLSAYYGGAENVSIGLDVVTVVGGSPVTSLSGADGASDFGVQAWANRVAGITNIGGTILGPALTSADISSGTVTLRLRYRTHIGSNKTVSANTNEPFHWYAKNLGPQL